MNSIRRQLTREFLGLTLLLLGGGIAALYLAAREATIEQFDVALRAKAMAVGTLTHVTPQGVSVEFSDRFLRGFGDARPRDFFEIWDVTAKPIARSESLAGKPSLPWRDGSVDKPARWNFNLPSGRRVRAMSFAFRPKAADPALRGHEPELRVVVVSDRSELDETLWQLLAISGGMTAFLIGATVWIVPRVLRRGLKSVHRLGERAAEVDASTLGIRFETEQLPIELRPIAKRLNDLLARLEASFERERRFSADLAHELRTPLAELRSVAECALKWPESRDPTTDRETVAVVQHMERIVTHILALARAEQGLQSATIEPVELAPLVRTVWEGFAARAEARGLDVRLALPALVASADAALLRSVLANLFDNAVDYTAAGGTIELTLADLGTGPVLTVANTAPDFRPEDVAKLFDRFWRKEAARSGGDHVGIGLALARGFAEAMGWTLTASAEPPRLVFRLAPAAAKSPPP